MNIESLFTVIYTGKLAKTANFYEDFFGFVPVLENDDCIVMECYKGKKKELEPDAKLDQKDDLVGRIVFMDPLQRGLPEQIEKGLAISTLSISVPNLEEAFEHYYYEGLDIVQEITQDPAGYRSFMLQDPAGNLLNIVEVNRDTVLSFPDAISPPVGMDKTVKKATA